MPPIIFLALLVILLAIVLGILIAIRKLILWYFCIDQIVELLGKIAKKP